MSSKEASLVIDEVADSLEEENFEPRLEVLVNRRYAGDSLETSSEVVRVKGRITVSF